MQMDRSNDTIYETFGNLITYKASDTIPHGFYVFVFSSNLQEIL